jgi:hypothetical protein
MSQASTSFRLRAVYPKGSWAPHKDGFYLRRDHDPISRQTGLFYTNDRGERVVIFLGQSVSMTVSRLYAIAIYIMLAVL